MHLLFKSGYILNDCNCNKKENKLLCIRPVHFLEKEECKHLPADKGN